MVTRPSCNVLVGVLTCALLFADPAAAQYSSVTDLGDLGGGASVATSINARGQVVGQVYTADFSSSSAFVWEKGVMTELPRLGGNHAGATGINARGQIVGQSDTADGESHAVMWEDGEITDLGTLGGSYSLAYAVNNRGVACGLSTTSTTETAESHAAVYFEGHVVDLGTLGGTSSQCFLGATNRGQFVGTSKIAGDIENHAFVTVDGVMTDLNPRIPPDSDWLLLEYAYGINERGQIVGAGRRDGMAPIRAFLLNPSGEHGDGQHGDSGQNGDNGQNGNGQRR